VSISQNESDEFPVEATDSHVTETKRSLGKYGLNIVVVEPVEAIYSGVGEVESGSGLFKSILKGSSMMRHDGLLM
jgi:hypothetical protein